MNTWKHLQSILLLPGTVTIIVPGTILYFTGIQWNPVVVVTGSLFLLLGLGLMISTIRLFVTVGRGTLAPWNPTQRLVVQGIYRHLRNPMISGVSCVLLGEAAIFGSLALLGWFGVFCLVNVIYIPLVEERGLVRRFGDDYLRYKTNVPRWIPRVRAWEDLSEDTSNDVGE